MHAPLESAEREATRHTWPAGTLESLTIVLVRLASIAVLMAVWRIAADLDLMRGFLFNSGVLSHWQVWFAGAVLLSTGALSLARRVNPEHAPQVVRTNRPRTV